jgi:DNA-binding NtrC family response regulator
VRAQVQLAATAPVALLIWGPSGSGRERLARSVFDQRNTNRKSRLVPLDCTLLDADLLQTTVEVYLRGSPDWPDQESITLLLLEIDLLRGDGQVALKRLLENPALPLRTIATSRGRLTQVDGFRSELADHLGTLSIELPPLQARLPDLPLLIQAAVEHWNVRRQRSLGGVTPDAMDALLIHPWKRNAAELYELIGEAHQRCQSPLITLADLPERIRLTADAEQHPPAVLEKIKLDEYLQQIERELITRALRVAKGNRAQAARLLGISRARLLRRWELLQLEP